MIDVGSIFGIALSAVLLLAWLSGDHVFQKVALLLMFAWASSNLAVNYLGFHRAPLVVPSIDAAVTLAVALVGHRNRSNTSLAIVCVYAIVGVVHVLALALQMQETYTYYATCNILFALALLILGGSATWVAILRRPFWRQQRARPYRPRLPYPG